MFMDFQEIIEESFKKTFEPFKQILSHYSCPDYCQAHCCKTCDIEFGRLEYKEIYNINPNTRYKLRTKTVTFRKELETNFGTVELVGYKFAKKPCPLLKNNKCSIQKVKPSTCYLYPFALAKHPTDERQVALEPCPMGVDVMADFLLCKFLSINYAEDMGDEEKERIIKGDLKLFKECVDSMTGMLTLDDVLDMYIHESLAEPFLHFLEDTSESDRKLDRETFGLEQIRIEKLKKFPGNTDV